MALIFIGILHQKFDLNERNIFSACGPSEALCLRYLNLRYPSGTGSSFNIRIDVCILAFFISGLISCDGDEDLRKPDTSFVRIQYVCVNYE